MIPLARSTIPQYFQAAFVLFCDILKSGDVQTTCVQTMIPTGRDFGSDEWINKTGIVSDPLGQPYNHDRQ